MNIILHDVMILPRTSWFSVIGLKTSRHPTITRFDNEFHDSQYHAMRANTMNSITELEYYQSLTSILIHHITFLTVACYHRFQLLKWWCTLPANLVVHVPSTISRCKRYHSNYSSTQAIITNQPTNQPTKSTDQIRRWIHLSWSHGLSPKAITTFLNVIE